MRTGPMVLMVVLGTMAACTDTRPVCEACPNGCCDVNGRCAEGANFDACGRSGGACEECNDGQVCGLDRCVAATGGGGGDGGAAGGGGGEPSTIDPSLAQVRVQFSLTPAVRSHFNSSDLLANVRGSFFKTEDIDPVFGPKKDVSKVLGLKVLSVDLRNRGTSAQSFTATVPPGSYTFLGVFDFNGNSKDDPGEPVTLFKTNELTLGSGEQPTRVLTFDYIR